MTTTGEAYDVAVIGGGPAGYVAAIRAAQLGGRVVLFEKDRVGGVCLNHGCIPTKTYLKTAEYIHHIQRAAERGILVSTGLRVDMPAVAAYKEQVIKKLTNGVCSLLKSNGVCVVRGKAFLTDPFHVECEGIIYAAKKIILCGGSQAKPLLVPGAGHKDVMTSDGILALTDVPKHLGIIGGGIIGCELASAFCAFGSRVTLIERKDRIVSAWDREVSGELGKGLSQDGVRICYDSHVKEIADQNGRPVIVTEKERIDCDKILVSIGREADLSCLGALSGQIRLADGRVAVDDTMKTSVDSVYACGDINGRAMLAHAAFKMGEVAAENCMTKKQRRCDLRFVPSCLYTSPESAFVGLTQEQAEKRYPQDICVGRFQMAANGRSLASGESRGFVKVIADKKYGQILGVHMVGGTASEMIAEPAALMAMEVTVHEAAEQIIHAHPSYSEAFAEACADALGRCIHRPPEKRPKNSPPQVAGNESVFENSFPSP